jgi:leucyl-tRNA synthetase
MSPTATEDEHLAAAMSLETIITALEGRTPLKTIVVPGRTVNIVVK